ncbi:hypothetical protein HDU84_006190 [Entophlyctis sp. JEL0112]|nr:hypothetical protein HDU84_006190 [Entophlyctis sp. JEL0112]
MNSKNLLPPRSSSPHRHPLSRLAGCDPIVPVGSPCCPTRPVAAPAGLPVPMETAKVLRENTGLTGSSSEALASSIFQSPSFSLLSPPSLPFPTNDSLTNAAPKQTTDSTATSNTGYKGAPGALALVTPPKDLPAVRMRFVPAGGGADWAAGIPGLVPLSDTFSCFAALPATVTFITSAVEYPPITKLHCPPPRPSTMQASLATHSLENDVEHYQGDFPTPNPSPFKRRRKGAASPVTSGMDANEADMALVDAIDEDGGIIKHEPSLGGHSTTTSPAQEHDAARLLSRTSSNCGNEDSSAHHHQPPRRQNALAAKAQALANALENLKVKRAQEAERLVQLLRSREGALGSYGAELRRFVAPPPQPQLAQVAHHNCDELDGRLPGTTSAVSEDSSNNPEQHENLDHKMPLSIVMERAAAMGKIPVGVAREVIRELELGSDPKPTDQVKSELLDNSTASSGNSSDFSRHNFILVNAEAPPVLIKRPRGRPRGSGRKRIKSDGLDANQVKTGDDPSPRVEFLDRSSQDDAAFLLSAAAALSQQDADRDASAGLETVTAASSPASIAASGTPTVTHLQQFLKNGEMEQSLALPERTGLDWLVLAARM